MWQKHLRISTWLFYFIFFADQPQCRKTQQVVYGAARGEVVSVTCEVDGNPAATMFRWTFNNSAERDREIIDFTTDDVGGRSVATYAPAQGYGTLLCWGRNELGPQSVPCAFHVVPAGKPESPRNCTLRNKTQTALFVACVRGFDGGTLSTRKWCPFFRNNLFDNSEMYLQPTQSFTNPLNLIFLSLFFSLCVCV